MAALEAQLRITAKDDSGAAIAALRRSIDAIDKQVATFDKLMKAAGNAMKANDPLIASIASTRKAFDEQRAAILGAADGLDRMAGRTEASAAAQSRLRATLERTTATMVAQGSEAVRVAEKINAAGRRGAAGGGLRHAVGDVLPFAGPGILAGTKEAASAGASVQTEIARLAAAGAKPADIAQARADFRAFSATHSGILESEYLTTYKHARVIAPGEAFEMAKLGSQYLAAARNSGVSTSESDVSNVLRIMDELGLKTMAQREDLLNNTLKSQQAFGSQISTETMLAAYRHAKQSIYDWSPEFRNRIFPTLLQSAGMQGGTEMMTALNNYVGGHMQQSELKALVAAGFVRDSDLVYNKVGSVKGLKPGAHLFEADTFKSNIAQWSWDFHREFMSRKGSTEDKFDDLIAKMPRNMAGLIAFMVHNDPRIHRDEKTLDLPVGLAAADDSYLAKNPTAGLAALKDSIEQFAAAVTAPAMTTIGADLQSLAHGIQEIGNAYAGFAAKNPGLAKSVGLGSLAAGAGVGGWLSWKLFAGVGKLLGFGGGSAAGGASGGAASAGGGILARFGLGGAMGAAGEVLGPLLWLHELGELMNPTTAAGARYRVDTAWPTQRHDMEMARRARLVFEGGGWVDDPEAAHARAYHNLPKLGGDDLKVSLDPNSKVEVEVTVKAEPTADLYRLIADAVAKATGSTTVLVGRSDSDAAPQRGGGLLRTGGM